MFSWLGTPACHPDVSSRLGRYNPVVEHRKGFLSGQLTKRALEESLKHLLLTKPLTKITIANLTEDCGVSRMTFYYHFQDIYDLVEWSCEEDARQALANNKTAETWQTGLANIMFAVVTTNYSS